MKKNLLVILSFFFLFSSCNSDSINSSDEESTLLTQEQLDSIDNAIETHFKELPVQGNVQIIPTRIEPEVAKVLSKNFETDDFHTTVQFNIPDSLYGYVVHKYNEQGIIETDFDGDGVMDFIIPLQVKPTPVYEDSYYVVIVNGKSFQVYLLETFNPLLSDTNFSYEYGDGLRTDPIDPKYYEMLPFIQSRTVEGVPTYYIQRTGLEEVYNPFYYEPETDKFEILGYD